LFLCLGLRETVMNYEMLRRKNKNYDRINDVMVRLCNLHFEMFPVLTSYRLTEDLDFLVILERISEEEPSKVLIDDRLFPYICKAEGVRELDIDYAACKGEWARFGNLRMFFYHGSPDRSVAKILLYNDKALLNKQVMFRVTR